MKETLDKIIFDSKTRYSELPIVFNVVWQTDLPKERLQVIAKDIKLYKYNNFLTLTGIAASKSSGDVFRTMEKRMKKGSKAYISIVLPDNTTTINTITYFNPLTWPKPDDFYFTITCFDYYNIRKGEEVYENITFDEYLINTDSVESVNEESIKKALQKMDSAEWFDSFDYKQKKNKENKDEITAEVLKKTEKKKKNNKESVASADKDSFVNLKSLKITKGSANPMRELDSIIGLNNIKDEIKRMQAKLEYDKKRKKRGIESDIPFTNHMVFMGNPGTGKTTVARIMTGILYDAKCIKENKCVEISGLDLQGGYVGQTGIITQQIVDAAKGGVLFVDEAYALSKSSYGKEAISVLLKEIEDNRGDIVVIFAGYDYDMNEFLDMNSGFRSRINKFFKFQDYSVDELIDILLIFLRKRHLKTDEAALEKIAELFNKAKKHAHFSNGRFVRNTVEKIEEAHIINVQDDADLVRNDTITIDDVPDNLLNELVLNI